MLLLMRHGRTDANAQGILAGRAPGVVLDEVGRVSAALLRERLASVPVAHVVTSPLERTIETAELAFGDAIPVSEDVRLIECDYGDWQGKPLAELSTHEMWPVVQQRPDEMIFPNGEAMSDMSKRAVAAVREWDARLTDEHGDKVIWAAVSHGDVIKAICADALGMPLAKFQRLMVEPASICVISYGEHGSSVVKLNDTGESWLTALGERARLAPTLGGEVAETNQTGDNA
jgi:probable phosphomutase (TIGR03848 family)